jgi:uncharacterized protein (DUF2141 family)
MPWLQAKSSKVGLCLLAGLYMHLHGYAQLQLHIRVEGLRNYRGQLLLSLFNQASGFPDDSKQSFRQMKIPLDSSLKPEGTWTNLPAGRYAVALLHDENEDGRCAVNWLGIPTEGIGISSRKNRLWGKPTFQSASFWLTRDTTIIIHVHYLF